MHKMNILEIMETCPKPGSSSWRAGYLNLRFVKASKYLPGELRGFWLLDWREKTIAEQEGRGLPVDGVGSPSV